MYGDTSLVLQNKLGSLENFSNIEKVKDDEKIVNSITGLLNTMDDLSTLAKEYSLEIDSEQSKIGMPPMVCTKLPYLY